MTETTAIAPADSVKIRDLFEREISDMEKGLIMAGLGTGIRMKCLWNISRHKLYRADGFKDMKAWVETTGYSYRRVTQLIREGDALAEMVFGTEVPEDKRWLSGAHVKQYVEAKRQTRLLHKHDTLCLPDSSEVTEVRADDIESEADLLLIHQAFQALPSTGAAARALTEGKKEKEDSVLELFIETINNAALQSISIAQKGGWGRATKKKRVALYYCRLAFFMLNNDKLNLSWVPFEEAELLAAVPERCPAHVAFALEIDNG